MLLLQMEKANHHFYNGIQQLSHDITPRLSKEKSIHLSSSTLSILPERTQFQIYDESQKIYFFQTHWQDKEISDSLGIKKLDNTQYQIRDCDKNTISDIKNI